MNVIQERDAALARVKELESDNRLLAADVQLQKSTISIGALLIADLKERLSKRDAFMDRLSDDLQCARLASELAAKERAALRQLVRAYVSYADGTDDLDGFDVIALNKRAKALLADENEPNGGY